MSDAEKNRVKHELDDLAKKGAIFFRQQSQTYELAAGSGEDPYDLIQRYLDTPALHPADNLAAFLEEAAGKRLQKFSEAKGYNLPFTEDKRFRVRFVRTKDLGETIWQELQDEQAANRHKPANSFEGVLVYALCEDEGDIAVAREASKGISAPNLALAVPHAPQAFTETLLRVKACRHYLPPSDAEKISAQTEARLRDIFENHEDGCLPMLQRLLQDIVEGSSACWYQQDGKVLIDKPRQAHKAADMLCETLFKTRCRIRHPDLNFCHDDKWRSGKNPALKQAVKMLLEAERVLIDRGNPDNHGQKHYLEKVLLRGAGALKKSGEDGSVTYFTCDYDPAKIHDDFPALKALCTRLADLNSGDSFQAGSFLEEMRKAPYGVGGTALMLSLAHIIRAYGESLIVSNLGIELPIDSYDALLKLVSDPAPQTEFTVRAIPPAQRLLLDLLANALNAPPLRHGEIRSLHSAFDLLKAWWKHVPPISRIISLYGGEEQPRLTHLKDLLNDLPHGIDRFDVLLEQLLAVYTDGPVDDRLSEQEAERIGTAFAADVKLLHSGEQLAQARVSQAICELYGTQGDIIVCEQAVKTWYESLNPSQRDPGKCEQEDARQFLLRLAEHNDPFSTKILNRLPADYGFGAVVRWTSLHVKDYAAKLKQAKAEIDKMRPHHPGQIEKSVCLAEGVHDQDRMPGRFQRTDCPPCISGTMERDGSGLAQ